MITKAQKNGNPKERILPQEIATAINRPRAGWEEQFKAANTKSDKQEKYFSENIKNKFDKNEWTWE